MTFNSKGISKETSAATTSGFQGAPRSSTDTPQWNGRKVEPESDSALMMPVGDMNPSSAHGGYSITDKPVDISKTLSLLAALKKMYADPVS